MGFKTDLEIAKATARIKLEKFKRKANVIFDTEALVEKIASESRKDGCDDTQIRLTLAFDPLHTVHVKVDRDVRCRDAIETTRISKTVDILYYIDNTECLVDCFADYLLDRIGEINDAIKEVKAMTPAPTPAATETPAARYAKALRELADKIEKGEV